MSDAAANAAHGVPRQRPQVMGILNVTPDSFSDGGLFSAPAAAIAHGQRLLDEGADIIDVGGESTRPGAAPVSEADELARVVPVVEALGARGARVCVDTSKPAVMRAAVAAGASMLNDVNALRAPGAIETAAALGVPVCLMHILGTPRTMQAAPQYDDVVAEVCAFLRERAAACERGGIGREKIILDPGFGFGKTATHNLQLLAALPRIVALGWPVLVGLSRKSLLGSLTGRPVEARLAGSVALATIAAWHGAHILRVHDVAATVDAVSVVQAVHAVQAECGSNS